MAVSRALMDADRHKMMQCLLFKSFSLKKKSISVSFRKFNAGCHRTTVALLESPVFLLSRNLLWGNQGGWVGGCTVTSLEKF